MPGVPASNHAVLQHSATPGLALQKIQLLLLLLPERLTELLAPK
jgi:hypothetical protein